MVRREARLPSGARRVFRAVEVPSVGWSPRRSSSCGARGTARGRGAAGSSAAVGRAPRAPGGRGSFGGWSARLRPRPGSRAELSVARACDVREQEARLPCGALRVRRVVEVPSAGRSRRLDRRSVARAGGPWPRAARRAARSSGFVGSLHSLLLAREVLSVDRAARRRSSSRGTRRAARGRRAGPRAAGSSVLVGRAGIRERSRCHRPVERRAVDGRRDGVAGPPGGCAFRPIVITRIGPS